MRVRRGTRNRARTFERLGAGACLGRCASRGWGALEDTGQRHFGNRMLPHRPGCRVVETVLEAFQRHREERVALNVCGEARALVRFEGLVESHPP